jgi:HlyD family secretion protein
VVDIPRQPRSHRRRYVYAAAGVIILVLATVALARLKPAAPTVDRATLWMDTVRRGEFIRDVRGPGTLVPEQIRWISALTPGRVEKINYLPGQPVKATTVLLQMSNPDLELQLLDSERQLAAARADLVNLRATLGSGILTQEGVVATMKAQSTDADRQAKVADGLAQKGLIADNELGKAHDQATEMRTRLGLEQDRLKILRGAMDSQIAAQQAQVDRLSAVVAFRRKELDAMAITAGADGVLQDLPFQVGQWATAGATLAKVVQPGRLKATLQIPETQARDVAIGLSASVDTRNGLIPGHVVRIDPAAQNGTVGVDVALDGPLPKGARPDLSVDGTIEIERLKNVLYVGRPAYGQPESTVGLFRVSKDGGSAVRVPVRLGRASVNTVEVLGGLNAGDVVILSDMSQWDAAERVRIR